MEKEPKTNADSKPRPDPELVWGDEAPVPIISETEEEKESGHADSDTKIIVDKGQAAA